MFRNLTGAIEKRKNSVARSSEETGKINRAFARFIAEHFSEAAGFKFDISYSREKDMLTIQTPNKTVANELVLRTKELSRVFRDDGLYPKQVVIR